MTPATVGQAWNEADSPSAQAMAQAYQDRWTRTRPGRRPDPDAFLRETGDSVPEGARLAVLRLDLTLRSRDGEPTPAEWYRDRDPTLSDDLLVALLYEEFCLRSEAGEAPDPAEFLARSPQNAPRLREILEIHALVAQRSATAPEEPCADPIVFPEAGETIGGFRLIEELGRGSFARVFLAHERHLADRPVALKITRVGSREPQTLARLQHTHIVPVHSFRTDPATGLHLLCMPFFGRVTLAQVLADPAVQSAREGQALVATVERLAGSDGPPAGSRGPREALGSRSYPRAVAWWGARIAEALRHAHDLGILHRDVKPSNILIAPDGTPMLLDFNLAADRGPGAAGATKLGGTPVYMAPEHRRAMLTGHETDIDHRADLYSLGLVLRELLGSPPPSAASTIRPGAAPDADLSHWRPSTPGAGRVPGALVAVVRRCLAESRDDRYASASDLAADLQAVADDAPLRFAREPRAPRLGRWLRRNAVRIAVALPLAVAIPMVAARQVGDRIEATRQETAARALIDDADRSAAAGDLIVAIADYTVARERTRDRPALRALHERAAECLASTQADREARNRADGFFVRADALRFSLLGFVGDQADASRDLLAWLTSLGVFAEADWSRSVALRRLDEPRRLRLIREVDDLLFLWVVAAALGSPGPGPTPSAAATAVRYCDLASRFTRDPGSWDALRRWWTRPGEASPVVPGGSDDEAFRRYLLAKLGADPRGALAWLERAARHEPGNYWHQFALGFEASRAGLTDRAASHYDAAIALKPGSPWAWKNRALVAERQGEWARALDLLGRSFEVGHAPADAAGVALELARTHQRIGRFARAREWYQRAIAPDPGGAIAHAARRDLARLEADSGNFAAAQELYNQVIAAQPDDHLARWGRARLWLRLGTIDRAGADLDRLIAATPAAARGPHLADRAIAWLAEGRPAEAEAVATLAVRLDPTAHHDRIRDRARLAQGLDLDRWPDRPDAFDALPYPGPGLREDLRHAADRMKRNRGDRVLSAVLLSAAGDHAAALDQIEGEPADDPRVELTRARIAVRAGWLDRAERAVRAGLAVAPESPELLGVRGWIRVERGEAAAGLADLAVAAARGGDATGGPTRARALALLGRHDEAARVWDELAARDPLDIAARLGVAASRRALGDWDRALAALEDAASMAEVGSRWLAPIALSYARTLPARPDRLPRVGYLAGRALRERGLRPTLAAFGERVRRQPAALP